MGVLICPRAGRHHRRGRRLSRRVCTRLGRRLVSQAKHPPSRSHRRPDLPQSRRAQRLAHPSGGRRALPSVSPAQLLGVLEAMLRSARMGATSSVQSLVGRHRTKKHGGTSNWMWLNHETVGSLLFLPFAWRKQKAIPLHR